SISIVIACMLESAWFLIVFKSKQTTASLLDAVLIKGHYVDPTAIFLGAKLRFCLFVHFLRGFLIYYC
ncbi:hypothetical protein SOVF_140280, partial [Spinacia oleracea]